MRLERGDVIRVRKMFYWHYGIYISDERIVHYSCAPQHWWEVKPKIKEVSLNGFLGIYKKYEVFFREEANREIIINKALCRIGEERYSLLSNNCKHFVMSCIASE